MGKRRWAWFKNWDYERPVNETAKKKIEEVEREECCPFCNQRQELHPLDLPHYTVRTLCDGTHIRP